MFKFIVVFKFFSIFSSIAYIIYYQSILYKIPLAKKLFKTIFV